MSNTPFGIPTNAPDLTAAIAVKTKPVGEEAAKLVETLTEHQKLKWATPSTINGNVYQMVPLEALVDAIAAIKLLAASPNPLAVETKPVAWLKTWTTGSDHCQRVDLHPRVEPWLAECNPTITPLYAAPQPLLDAPRVMALEWQPIDTAPRDGRMILLYNSAHGEQSVLGWTNGFNEEIFPGGCWTDAGSKNKAINHTVNAGYFQFWQPLPAPPTLQSDGEGE